MAQRARLLLELGDDDLARAAAVSVQPIRQSAPTDVTAAAIAGSAAILLFNSSDWQSQQLGEVIAAADNAASWWRAQVTAQGLEAMSARAYSAWGRDRSVTIGGEDVANNSLFSASFVASNAADQAGWRHLTRLLGQDMLMRLDRSSDPQGVRDALNALRVAGDEKGLKLAVQHLVADGPTAGVTKIAAEVDLEQSTRTTALADLALFRSAGDVLDDQTVARTVDWLIKTLADPSAFEQHSGTYWLELALVEALAAVTPAAQGTQLSAIADYLESLPREGEIDPGRQQVLSQWWATIVRALPRAALSEERTRSLAARSKGYRPELRTPIRGLLARFDSDERTRLMDEAAAGSQSALEALGNVKALPGETAAAVIAGIAREVEQVREHAHEGRFGMSHDAGQALVVLNAWHPDVSQWTPLYELLADSAVSDADKRGALGALAGLVDQLPADARETLKPLAAGVAERASDAVPDPFDRQRDAKGAGALLEAALGALDPDGAADRVLDLLAQDSAHRQWAAHVATRLGQPTDVGILAALIEDPDVSVRAIAAAGIASLVAGGRGGALAVTALRRSASESGVLVPLNVADVLSRAETLTAEAEQVLDDLRNHPSARVRSRANGDVEL